jgi:hypothetical protein
MNPNDISSTDRVAEFTAVDKHYAYRKGGLFGLKVRRMT